MNISAFDLFSIGIGPSSSHTVGPMRAANHFVSFLREKSFFKETQFIECDLFGSLALTGKGHGTDLAILNGLSGFDPETVDPDSMRDRALSIYTHHTLLLGNEQSVTFQDEAMRYHFDKVLPKHSNGMRLKALDASHHVLCEEIYYSIGGGFIVVDSQGEQTHQDTKEPPYAFQTSKELMTLCETHHLRISELMWANELTWRDKQTIQKELMRIAKIMGGGIQKGFQMEGVLPGGLNLKRRAPMLYQKLKANGSPNPEFPIDMLNWVNACAISVAEVNASGGRVITAPTNGSAGVIPAVINYYQTYHQDLSEESVITFLLTASAIGILFKKGASISGAEVGCQGEIGVAASMAAAGLTAVLGGSLYQIENAAEIAMEHHLGLTCDPVKGLVQIPCIERNAMGAIKAINSARLSLLGDGNHSVSLDGVIATMKKTGEDMKSDYKETAQGGLAILGGTGC